MRGATSAHPTIGFNGAAPMMERKTCRSLASSSRAASTLQWGRSDDGAENRMPCRSAASQIGFNGAAPMMERKTDRLAVIHARLTMASMGPLR